MLVLVAARVMIGPPGTLVLVAARVMIGPLVPRSMMERGEEDGDEEQRRSNFRFQGQDRRWQLRVWRPT